MHLARKLFLLLAMALTALAMSATTASANSPVVVHDELGNHCDPCPVVAHGESVISHPIIGPVTTCEDTFHGEVREDGEGHITALINQDHAGQACTTQNCNGVGEPPSETEWPFHMEEDAAGEVEKDIIFCLDSKADPNATGSHCAVTLHIEEHGPHHYEAFLPTTMCPNGLSVTGSWEIEDTPIEIEHPIA